MWLDVSWFDVSWFNFCGLTFHGFLFRVFDVSWFDLLCPKNNLNIRLKLRHAVTAGADATIFFWVCLSDTEETSIYVQCTYVYAIHQLQPGQVRLLCAYSDYFWGHMCHLSPRKFQHFVNCPFSMPHIGKKEFSTLKKIFNNDVEVNFFKGLFIKSQLLIV